MVRDATAEKTLFINAFGVDAMQESFNRNAALYLQDHMLEYITDESKAEDALNKITKLLELSQVCYYVAEREKERGWSASC